MSSVNVDAEMEVASLFRSGLIQPGDSPTDSSVNAAIAVLNRALELYLQGSKTAGILLRSGVDAWEPIIARGKPRLVSVQTWVKLPPAIVQGRLTLDGPRGAINTSRVQTVSRQIDAAIRLCAGMSDKRTCHSNLADMIRPWEVLLSTSRPSNVSIDAWTLLTGAVGRAKGAPRASSSTGTFALQLGPGIKFKKQVSAPSSSLDNGEEPSAGTPIDWFCTKFPDRCRAMTARCNAYPDLCNPWITWCSTRPTQCTSMSFGKPNLATLTRGTTSASGRPQDFADHQDASQAAVNAADDGIDAGIGDGAFVYDESNYLPQETPWLLYGATAAGLGLIGYLVYRRYYA